MLQLMDKLWKDHLATMDLLRAGIGLRGYAGRNPKQEYKRESFGMFEHLLDQVKYDVTRYLARIQIASPEEIERMQAEREKQEAERRERMSMQHPQAAAIGQPTENASPSGRGSEDLRAAAQAAENRTKAEAKPFVREDRKVGRNEPCPCGSGKKFKQCHGKIG